MGLGVNEDDVNDLAAEHSEELTTEALKELHVIQQPEIDKQPGNEEEDSKPEEILETKAIKDMLAHWEAVKTFVGQNHPEQVHTSRAIDLFDDICLTYFNTVLKGRRRQTTLDGYIKSSKQSGVKSKENNPQSEKENSENKKIN